VACAGKPACASAARDAQADALVFARELPGSDAIVLHVSGCSKGCARPAPMRLTLVANADGYDAVLGGRADGAPALRNLTLDAARRLVAQECRLP
jgi:precorrin-3B synthase